jgi:hypothetical protein
MTKYLLAVVVLIAGCAHFGGGGSGDTVDVTGLQFCIDEPLPPTVLKLTEEQQGGVYSVAFVCSVKFAPAPESFSYRLQGQPPLRAVLVEVIILKQLDRLASQLPAIERHARAVNANIVTPNPSHPLHARGFEVFNAYHWAGDK